MRPSLSRRLEFTILEKFNYDYGKSLEYIRQRCEEYSKKSYEKVGTKHHSGYHAAYKAYVQAEFSIFYTLEMRQELKYDR